MCALRAALDADGFALAGSVLDATDLQALDASLSAIHDSGAGTRSLLDFGWCRMLAGRLRNNALPEVIGRGDVAVQCTLFDKTPSHNWLVAPHQDLSIPVASHVPHAELRNWTKKEGQHFVQPPDSLLTLLVAVRLHIDDCPNENGALRVVPRSHTKGRIPEDERLAVRDQLGEVACPGSAGDALIFKPLLLHASSKSRLPARRRVLHFLFGPTSPGYGLSWAYSV